MALRGGVHDDGRRVSLSARSGLRPLRSLNVERLKHATPRASAEYASRPAWSLGVRMIRATPRGAADPRGSAPANRLNNGGRRMDAYLARAPPCDFSSARINLAGEVLIRESKAAFDAPERACSTAGG